MGEKKKIKSVKNGFVYEVNAFFFFFLPILPSSGCVSYFIHDMSKLVMLTSKSKPDQDLAVCILVLIKDIEEILVFI